MIVVDSSIWIHFFNKLRNPDSLELKRLIEGGEDLALTEINLTEVLQGIGDDRVFEEISRLLHRFPILRANGPETFVRAAQIYRRCRKKGRAVRKTVDCVIAAICLENGVELFHGDRDFEVIALETGLKIYKYQ